MAVELVKDGAKLTDNLPSHKSLVCGQCPQRYAFRYSDGESNRLNEWLPKAQAVVDSSHAGNHAADCLSVS